MKEVDFSNSNLSQSVFENSNLSEAIFENSNLEKADFRTAQNYSIHPENNRIKSAKFSMEGIAGLLYRYGIELN